VEDIPSSPVIYTRRLKKNYKNADVSIDRWFELFQMVSKQRLRIMGPIILTYHNNPLEQFFKTDCDLEISVKVNETRNQPEFKQFGGFRAVTALHFGKNEEIIQTHVKAIKWLNEQGYNVSGPISEEYIISPVDINNEEDHITKIIIPMIKPALATAVVLVFQQVWGALEASNYYINDEGLKSLAFYMNTLSNASNGVAGQGMQAAASLILFIPNLIVFCILQKNVMNTMAHSGIK
jgi:effector-binding domain-containing protein